MKPKPASRRSVLQGSTALFTFLSSQPLLARQSATTAVQTAAAAARLPLSAIEGIWTGPGWERLLTEARSAQFLMIGEEHGTVEIPALASQLFAALRPAGFDRVFVETSAVAAQQIDTTLSNGGCKALRKWLADDPLSVAFFSWQEEAEFLTGVRRLVPRGRQAIFGTDYEPFASRQLAALLVERATSPALRTKAQALLETIIEARRAAAAHRDLTRLFGFSDHRTQIEQLLAQWPYKDVTGLAALRTMQRTAEINSEFARGARWRSNQLRASFQRESFLTEWRSHLKLGQTSRIMFKYGANHMRRGMTPTKVFDLGTLLPELAEERGSRAYQLLILPGRGSVHTVLNPQSFAMETVPAVSLHEQYLNIFDSLVGTEASLFDLRALRALADNRAALQLDPDLVATIHGFDALLVIPETTAATSLIA